jgi:hypothetical protein
MPTSAKELVGWSDQRWQSIQDGLSRVLAATAKCRQVIPKGPELIGEKTIPVSMIEGGAGKPYEISDETTAPVYLSVELQFDDQHAVDEAVILRLIESAAAELGKIEDIRVLKAKGGTPRNQKLIPWGAADKGNLPTCTPRAAVTDASGLLIAITEGVAALAGAARPGPCGLILANQLLAWLQQPVRAGDAPPIHQAEQLIGSSQIVGTSVLDGAKTGEVFGILMRLEPPAADLVFTELPTVSVLERTAGKTKLGVEEEIAFRVLDNQAMIQMLVK